MHIGPENNVLTETVSSNVADGIDEKEGASVRIGG
jgi:hypothetical protein